MVEVKNAYEKEKKKGVKQIVEVKNEHENNRCWTNGRSARKKKKENLCPHSESLMQFTKIGVKQMLEIKDAYRINGCWTNGRFDQRKKDGCKTNGRSEKCIWKWWVLNKR